MSAEMLFPQESFLYRSQGKHGNPSSEDYGWRSTVGGYNQWLIASYDGVITTLVDGYSYDPNGGLGNYYVLTMDNGCKVRCGHCQRGSFAVKKGDRIARGQRICRMGNSGYCIKAAYHTHMTFWNSNGSVTLPTQSGMKVLTGATIYEGQPNMFTYESVIVSVGEPVSRDSTKNQIEVRIDSLRARTGHYTSASVLGYCNKGIYPYLAVNDSTAEQSNGFLWYQIQLDPDRTAWIAYSDEWETVYPAASQDGKDKIIEDLQTENTALKDQNNILTARNTKMTADFQSIAAVAEKY